VRRPRRTSRSVNVFRFNLAGGANGGFPLFKSKEQDATGSFSTGLIYASVLCVISCLIVLILPIPSPSKTTA
jgi:hypothetical protein